MNDYRVVIGINLGTTHSGFSYSYMSPSNICIHSEWKDGIGHKVPTILYYDDVYKNVRSWGFPRPTFGGKPVELFKLLLGKMENELSLLHEKAIIDYLHELSKIIKRAIQQVDLHTQALIVLTVPDDSMMLTQTFFTMREYVYKAGLLKDPLSHNFGLITESKAIEIFCMKYLKKHNLSVGEKFIIVDCRDNAVHLTTMLLWKNEKLCLISERVEANCGGDFVDQEFHEFLNRKISSSGMNPISENQFQIMKQAFNYIKKSFSGVQSEFVPFRIYLEANKPVFVPSRYNSEANRPSLILTQSEFSILLNFEDVKAIFEPIIERIIQLIDYQLRLCYDSCYAILLVGEFGKSKYLQLRIEEKFRTRTRHISRPPYSDIAILRGAVLHGIDYVILDQAYIIKLVEKNKELEEENIKLGEENKKVRELQLKHGVLTSNYNREINQNRIIVETLKNDIKGIGEKYQNKISVINQQHQNKIELQGQRAKQIQNNYYVCKNNFDKYKLLHDNLQEKYVDLQEKYNEEINQNQIIIEKLRSDIERIEEKYQNQISDIDQQYQNKFKLQEQRINQLQQSLELKENKLQDLGKEKKELNVEYDNLHQKNANLMNQLENILQQNTSCKDDISNYQLENIDQNYIISLNSDISKLNGNLKSYITDLNQDVIVNMEEIKKLLLLYKCSIKITNQKDDQLLIQAVLQRHVIETILSYAIRYFQCTGQHYHLESDIINKSSLLSILLANISKYRMGNDEITKIATTKLRQHVYTILDNRGFADIYGKNDATYEHPFIAHYKEKLNKTMDELRIIRGQEKITCENLAATIIREVIKIFWFRLKIHESPVQYAWIPYNAKVDETFMKRSNFDNDDDDDLYVGLCYFPLIGRDIASNNKDVFVPAKVFAQKINFNNK
ncbi:hypothetical protein RclHR1_00460010 [Rhizophagus clarus]|uniref:Hsp70 family protein n=1 Tax=Rhizophagus clarus TaxID=94130 RepID=A0A2Z6S0R5_9GLOM|nr:hypothetical protein RclHR1_00460010 [Rhizophagus clarus]GES73207.1 hypothetical protein GLOIN_2v1662575 [Rhizophagus clarus]